MTNKVRTSADENFPQRVEILPSKIGGCFSACGYALRQQQADRFKATLRASSPFIPLLAKDGTVTGG